MKLQFKVQQYQTDAVDAVVDVFTGQPHQDGTQCLVGPPLRNAEIALTPDQLLTNIRAVQRSRGLEQSAELASSRAAPDGAPNLSIEMETGTGKTYVYVKTIMELSKRYGWSKFIVVVPSVAIREGVLRSFDVTAEHFQQLYGARPRAFVYSSSQLHEIQRFSSDGGVQVMIINIQAFNATGEDQRRIYDELDDFQSRRPIDVIRANRPIVIIDEPQRFGEEFDIASGEPTKPSASLESLARLNALMVLRYSATHKPHHDYTKVHRLDAVDAYNQQLVKKIGVRGITVTGLAGSTAYLYLDAIEVRKGRLPEARVQLETRTGDGAVVRSWARVGTGTDLHVLARDLEAYTYDGRALVVTDVNAVEDFIELSNGRRVYAGEVTEDITEETRRRIQIREVVRAHVRKERELLPQGVKVLSLLFIDKVVKYRDYERSDTLGDYARIFEEEYAAVVDEILSEPANDPATRAFHDYLRRDTVREVHGGYFSVDRKTGRQVDPLVARRGDDAGQGADAADYDLILKDKERLLSFETPLRFLFSHSALREGWDNPNVFVIGMLKQSDNTVSRRQEVGRGLRLAVDQRGERMDNPVTVHDVNELTVVCDESYDEFVAGLQQELAESLHGRRADPLHGELPTPVNDRKPKENPLNQANLDTEEFQALWGRICRRAGYRVAFDSGQLVRRCVEAMDTRLKVAELRYAVETGAQASRVDAADPLGVAKGSTTTQTATAGASSQVRYDLLGEITQQTHLTRRTAAAILTGIAPETFAQYRLDPERFITETARLVNEQKAAVVVENLTYEPVEDRVDPAIFTRGRARVDFAAAGDRLEKHVYDYVVTDSEAERRFVTDLETSAAVLVYAKLPHGFVIPTPIGDHYPGWAIAFAGDSGKPVYVVADTTAVEEAVVECARRFFDALCRQGHDVRYGVVTDYAELAQLVSG
jgi:type III restriction enzyme